MKPFRPSHATTRQLLERASKDTDPISVFVNGTDWSDADCAIFVVKGRDRARAVYAMFVRQDLITEGKPVVSGETTS